MTIKSIAENKFGTSKTQTQMTVIAFSTFTNLFAVSGALALHEYWQSIKANLSYEWIASVFLLTVVSSLFVNVLGLFLQYIVSIVTLHNWPYYFVYVFEFEGEYIIGQGKIFLDCITKPPAAKGRSYTALPTKIDFDSKTKWKSIAVTGGSFRGEKYCYAIYALDSRDAINHNRPEEGLLVFHFIEEGDSELNMPDRSILGGKNRYIGRQQGIDRNGTWNFMYAEELRPDGSTPSEKEANVDEMITANRALLIQEYERLKRLAP
jgi:hypothetical protein